MSTTLPPRSELEPLTATVAETRAHLGNISDGTINELFRRGFDNGGLDCLKLGKRSIVHMWQIRAFINNLPTGIVPKLAGPGRPKGTKNKGGRPSKAIAAALVE
jgi:hypothetical protein